MTKDRYDFFKSLYEEEGATSEELEGRAKVYLGIVSAFVFALLNKGEDAVKSAAQLKIPLVGILGVVLTFSGALIAILWALRIRSFEYVADAEEIIDAYSEEGPSEEEFFEDRIADFAVAASRNRLVNDKIATALVVASWLLIAGMVFVFGLFAYSFWRET